MRENYGKLVLDKDAVIYFSGKSNVKSKLMTSETHIGTCTGIARSLTIQPIALGAPIKQPGEVWAIETENCTMTSVGIDDTIPYHNPGNPDNVHAKNLIYVKNPYLNGTTLVANHGNSDDTSIGYTIGCPLGPAPKLERKVEENRKDNMKILEWGNTIRGTVEP